MQSTNNDTKIRGIKRTICIGLGGTGKDVLMRIRRLIVDRYDDFNNLPIVSFVHIDTDKAATQVSGLRTGSTYHGVDLSFRDAEKVSASLAANEVNNFVKELERRLTSDRPGPYDHIARWFPPQLIRNIKAVEEGAKGIRPVGRLAFFHNYQKIKTAIETAERRTRGHEATLLRYGLRVEPGLNIFVVGSLCGGTGSGMFLDVAYSLRKTYGDQGAEIVGYLVISPQLYGNTSKMIANTYAALKELNHYTIPGTKFEACYDIQNLILVQESRPPFDYTYLVSHQTSGEYAILEQRKLCNVIAHKIALEFFGELAPVVQGIRDNFLQELIKWDNHPRPNVQRYLSFGLAAIYFPRDTIVNLALTRISLKLVNFWLTGKGQSPDPQLLLEQFLIQYRWHSDLSYKNGFSTRLSESVFEGNKTFITNLNKWKNDKIGKKVNDCKSREDREELKQNLPRELREQFRKTQPGETESTRGIWLTRLLQVRPQLEKQFKENIDEFLAELMTPSNGKFSIKSARDWLDALESDLNNYQRQLEEEITLFGGMKKIEDVDKKWRDTEQRINDIEQKFELPLVSSKNREVQAEAKQILKEVYDLIKKNFDIAVTQEALQIVKELQKHVRERVTQQMEFNRLVDHLKTTYEKEESDLKQLNFDEMSGEAIFADEDIEECYQTLLPDQDFRDQLVLVSKEITGVLGVPESLAYLMNRTSSEQLKTEIDLKIDGLFGSRSNQIVKSVIKRFIQHYAGTKASIRLGQIFQQAEPLLRLNLSDPYFSNGDSKSEFLGFKDTDDPEVKQFKTILSQDLGIQANVLKPTQAEDEILMVTERAGFPLRLISGLEEMRNPYTRERNLDGSMLHSDYRIAFTDIIPPDPILLEELEEIFYPGLAFNLIYQDPQTQRLEFKYYDQLRDCYDTTELSPVWTQALEELANRRDMKEALKELLNEAIAQMEEQPQLWEEDYLPKLQQFVKQVDKLTEESPNFPYKSTVVGVSGTSETLAKEGIINRFRKKMQERFKVQQSSKFPTSDRMSNQKAIAAEIVVAPFDKGEDNRLKRRHELEQLQQDLDKNYVTQEEYEREREKILKQYPLS